MKLEEMRKIAEQRNKEEWKHDESSGFQIVKIPCHKAPDGYDHAILDHYKKGETEVDTCDGKAYYNAKFIALAANTYDALLDIAEAAKKHIPSERNYCAKELNKLVGYDVYGELKDALKKLEDL